MKRVTKILKWTGKVVLGLIVFIAVLLTASYIIGKQDYGSPKQVGDIQEKIAFTNVNVIPMDSAHILENRVVLIEEGKIHSILTESPDLSNYQVIDAQGKYLMPGLMDAHAHIFDRSDLALYLSQGVTSVRNMMGFPMHLRWKAQVANYEFPGASLFTASPTLNMGDNTGGPFHKVLSGPEEGSEAVLEAKNDGYDFIKIYDGLNSSTFNAIMEEANSNNFRVAGHPPRDVDFSTLVNSGLASIEHAEEVFQGLMDYKYNRTKADSIAKLIAEKEMYVTPSLIIYHYINRAMNSGQAFLDSIPQDYVNPFIRMIGRKQMGDHVNTTQEGKDYSNVKNIALSQILEIFHRNGVPLLLGTDFGPNLTVAGYIMHQEIELWKKYGIPSFDILEAGTRNVADVLGVEDRFGTIQEGKEAQLILLDKNPLDDVMNVKLLSGVYHQGIWYNKEQLMDLQQIGLDKSSTFSTIGRFLEYLLKK